ncbi:MAG: apolipoprotein N-acyltransferase [Akkermansiaceae bacterium]
MRLALRLLGAAGSGAALALCFAPFDQAWLVWGWMWILLPLLWTVKGKRSRLRGFGLGFFSGFVFWAINLKWIGSVTWLGVFAFAVYLGIYFGLFGAFAAKAGNPWLKTTVHGKLSVKGRFGEMGRSLGYAALLAGLWCGLEWIRGWFLTGFGWNGLGVTFSQNLVLAQNAEFVGVIGLSFLPVFVSAVVVQTAKRFVGQATSGGVRLVHWDFAVALLVVMLAFTVGTHRLVSVVNAPKVEARFLLVQQDIPQFANRVVWEAHQIVDGFVELTEDGLKEVEQEAEEAMKKVESDDELVEVKWPDFVVWPEACLPYHFWIQPDGRPETGPGLESVIKYIGDLGDFTMVVGINEAASDDTMSEATDRYNSLMTRTADDQRETYKKHHLVVFGETLPDFEFIYDLYERTAGAPFSFGLTAGESFEPLKVQVDDREMELIPSICFEDTVPRLTRRFVRSYPQMIVNVTNDGWFQETEGSLQHFRNSLFRSIELRRPMIRCANRGVTGIISATGSTVDPYTKEERRLLDENGSHFHRGYLHASAYALEQGGITVYAAFGDWFAVAGLVIAVLWGGVGLVRNLVNRKTGGEG